MGELQVVQSNNSKGVGSTTPGLNVLNSDNELVNGQDNDGEGAVGGPGLLVTTHSPDEIHSRHKNSPWQSPQPRGWWIQKFMPSAGLYGYEDSLEMAPKPGSWWSGSGRYWRPRSRQRRFRFLRSRSWDDVNAEQYCLSDGDIEENCFYDDDDDLDDLDDVELAERRFGTVRDTLDEVKARLRSGMERRVQKARSRVNKFREASSHYATWVREASSNYASRMREAGSQYALRMREAGSNYARSVRDGVAMGMEHMKFTMKSMKELCGTGDIMSTVSTFSIATDVDSQQQTEIVRTVTYI